MSTSMWGVQLDLPETFGDFGKEWTEGRAIVWKAFQMDAVVTPPKQSDASHNIGWWIGLVDFLTFALGADDVAQFLRQWRQNGYPTDSPVRRFIRRNWGDSVAVLELYLYVYPYAHREIQRYASRCRGATDANLRETAPTPCDERTFRSAGMLAWEAIQAGHDASLMSFIYPDQDMQWEDALTHLYLELTDDSWTLKGWDGAHLSAHFAYTWYGDSVAFDDNDQVRFSGSADVTVFLQSYAGWYQKLHDLRRELLADEDNMQVVERVDVQIRGLGSIGTFVFDAMRQCFVLDGEETGDAAASRESE